MRFEALANWIKIFCIILLVGCAAPPRPFQPNGSVVLSKLASPIDAGGLGLSISSEKEKSILIPLTMALTDALGEANIPVSSSKEFAGRYHIECRVSVSGPNHLKSGQVVLSWKLLLSSGKLLGTYKQEFGIKKKNWVSSDPGLIIILAKDASQQILTMLDPVSVNNRRFVELAGIAAGEERVRDTVLQFYLVGIKGLTREQFAPLSRSLTFLFEKKAGFVMAKKNQANYFLKGDIHFGSPVEGSKVLDIVWNLSGINGNILGKVRQSNRITIVDLDKYWERTAHDIADGAVQGVIDLINKHKYR